MTDNSVDRAAERAHLPVASPPKNHGHTTAAWVTVVVVVLGALVASVGVMVAESWMFWAGIAVIVVGLVVGRVLAMLGLGQPRPGAPRRDRDDDV